MKGNSRHQFTVSGPGVDVPVAAASLGLSRAINLASDASRNGREETFYVRDPKGEVVGRTEADGLGCVDVYGERWYR